MQFLILFTLYFLIFTYKFANFCNLYQKSANLDKKANLDNFFPKKCNFGQFPLLKVKIMGKFFTNFLLAGEKIDFCGRIFTYGSRLWTRRWMIFWFYDFFCLHFVSCLSAAHWSQKQITSLLVYLWHLTPLYNPLFQLFN